MRRPFSACAARLARARWRRLFAAPAAVGLLCAAAPASHAPADAAMSGSQSSAVVPAHPHPVALAPEERWATRAPTERDVLIHALHQKLLQQRVVEASRRFLDTPYAISPLGEGQGPDPDPMIRYDAVDCLTFVETSIALALAGSDAEVEPILRKLRYGSSPVFEDRNHLMESEWLPHNIAKGFIRDVTARYGGADAIRVQKRLTKESWLSPSSKSLGLPEERQIRGVFPLTVVPLDKVLARAEEIPSGTIVVVVREDLPFKVTRVTHLGFLVQKHGRPYLRHAAKSVYERVVDEDLESFLTRNARYDKWRVTGLAFFQVLQPPAPVLSSAVQQAAVAR